MLNKSCSGKKCIFSLLKLIVKKTKLRKMNPRKIVFLWKWFGSQAKKACICTFFAEQYRKLCLNNDYRYGHGPIKISFKFVLNENIVLHRFTVQVKWSFVEDFNQFQYGNLCAQVRLSLNDIYNVYYTYSINAVVRWIFE